MGTGPGARGCVAGAGSLAGDVLEEGERAKWGHKQGKEGSWFGRVGLELPGGGQGGDQGLGGRRVVPAGSAQRPLQGLLSAEVAPRREGQGALAASRPCASGAAEPRPALIPLCPGVEHGVMGSPRLTCPSQCPCPADIPVRADARPLGLRVRFLEMAGPFGPLASVCWAGLRLAADLFRALGCAWEGAEKEVSLPGRRGSVVQR